MNIPDMPEHVKLANLKPLFNTIQTFLFSLRDREWEIVHLDSYGDVLGRLPYSDSTVYEYLGIDFKKLETEREQAIQYVLAMQERPTN